MHRFQLPTVFCFLVAVVLVGGALSTDARCQSARKSRALAPGVLQTIPIDLNPRDTHSLPVRMPGVQSTAWTPNTLAVDKTLDGQARQVTLYRDPVWELEFSFVPLRQETVKSPNNLGELNNVNVWYMLFRVRNVSATMSYKEVRQTPDSDVMVKKLEYNQAVASEKIKFIPQFFLEGWVQDPSSGLYEQVNYASVIDPAALIQIQQIEDPNQKLLDVHQISKVDLPLAQNDADPGVWGVAIWRGVNPNIDYVSVKVAGLTNARRVTDAVTHESVAKTLQLNFWRPGDAIGQRRDDISYGIPLVDNPREQIRICKFYDLPGPQLQTFEVNPTAKRELLIGEIDGAVDLKTFRSPLTDSLDAGAVPPVVALSVAPAGLEIPAGTAVNTVISGRKWTFQAGEKQYVIKLEPQFWEPDFGKIRFINTLDYLWIYR